MVWLYKPCSFELRLKPCGFVLQLVTGKLQNTAPPRLWAAGGCSPDATPSREPRRRERSPFQGSVLPLMLGRRPPLRLVWMFGLIGHRCSARFPKQLLPVGELCPFLGWEETGSHPRSSRHWEGRHAFPARFGNSDSQFEVGGIPCSLLRWLSLQCLRVGLWGCDTSLPDYHNDNKSESESENCLGSVPTVPHHVLALSWKPLGPGSKLCFPTFSSHLYYLLVLLCTRSLSHRSVVTVPRAAKKSL